MDEMIAERTKLAERMADLDTGAFPGSKAWMAYNAALKAVAAFDAAHPEVLAEINRRHSAKFAHIDRSGV